LSFSRLGRARDEAQAMALHEIVQVLDANSGKIRDLSVSEYFLARFYGYHGLASPYSANSQYLTNIHASGPARQRPATIATST
jgi:hypothetical protein